MSEPDVLIIGSGQAGAPLSWRLARAGRRVVLVERKHLGGTCVNVGCTPTKTFIASAEAAHRARAAGDFGVDVGDVRVAMAAVVRRKRAVVEKWRSGVASNVEKADGLRLVRGHARFVGPRAVEVDGERFEPETVIVDTGARPAVPSLPGLETVPWLDNARVMELEAIPDHLVVLGGGYIGCELGQAMRRFGAAVTVVDTHDHLMSREDAEVSEALQDAFRAEGIDMVLGARSRGVHGTDDGGIRLELDGRDAVEGSHLLVAVGRRPNTDDLGCDAAGLERDEHGYLVVDDAYRTSADGVYAVGDCTGPPQFTHVSWDDHRILFDILEGGRTGGRSGRVVPYAAFTDPQIGRVGLSEKEAKEAGVPHEVATLPFERIARAYETGRTAGLVKVLIHTETERILGAAVVGAEAAELITVFQALMLADAPASTLVDGQMIHPAFVEGLQSALMTLPRYKLS